MAISFNTGNSYGYSLLPLFGVAQSLCTKAKESGVLVEQSSPGTFLVKYHDKVYGTIPIKGSAITLAKAGQLGPASKSAIEFQFKKALEEALKYAAIDNAKEKYLKLEDAEVIDKGDEEDVGPYVGSGTKTGKMSSTTPNLSNVPKSAFSALKVETEAIDLAKEAVSGLGEVELKNPSQSAAAGLPVTKLAGASCLYQKVFGTSSGSVYYLLAMFKGCNMAVRFKGAVLSVRFEGQGIKNYAAAFSDLGIVLKSDYASQHYHVGNSGLALKTFGAVVARMGITNLLSVGDLSHVEVV